MCKNELFKVQGHQKKLMYNLETKTIFWPLFFCYKKGYFVLASFELDELGMPSDLKIVSMHKCLL